MAASMIVSLRAACKVTKDRVTLLEMTTTDRLQTRTAQCTLALTPPR